MTRLEKRRPGAGGTGAEEQRCSTADDPFVSHDRRNVNTDRAKRRARKAAAKPPLLQFHEISAGAVEALVVTPPDATATAIMRSLNNCLFCDPELTSGAAPAAFALTIPFANPVAAPMRPDLHTIEGGRA